MAFATRLAKSVMSAKTSMSRWGCAIMTVDLDERVWYLVWGCFFGQESPRGPKPFNCFKLDFATLFRKLECPVTHHNNGATYGRYLSLSDLNHWLPRIQAHPEVVQAPQISITRSRDALLPQADPVFHNAAALDTTVDVSIRSRRWWSAWLPAVLQGQLRTAGLLRRHEDRTSGA